MVAGLTAEVHSRAKLAVRVQAGDSLRRTAGAASCPLRPSSGAASHSLRSSSSRGAASCTMRPSSSRTCPRHTASAALQGQRPRHSDPVTGRRTRGTALLANAPLMRPARIPPRTRTTQAHEHRGPHTPHPPANTSCAQRHARRRAQQLFAPPTPAPRAGWRRARRRRPWCRRAAAGIAAWWGRSR